MFWWIGHEQPRIFVPPIKYVLVPVHDRHLRRWKNTIGLFVFRSSEAHPLAVRSYIFEKWRGGGGEVVFTN